MLQQAAPLQPRVARQSEPPREVRRARPPCALPQGSPLWEAPAWAKPSAALGNSASSRPRVASQPIDAADLDRAVALLQAAFSLDQVAALAAAPVWHFATSVASVRAMAGSVPANRDASALRTALEVLGSDSPAGRQFRCNLVQRPPEEVAVDFQLLQAELGAFIAAAASLKKVTASRQPALKIREGLASSTQRASKRAIPEGIQSAGGRPSIPAAMKAYTVPTESALEENSIGFILSESCLVARGALTRKKEQAKDKKRCEEVPKTRKASKPDVHEPEMTVASTAVPRSTICSEGSSFSERHLQAHNLAESRQEVYRSPEAEQVLRWPESPSGASRRRDERPRAAPRSPSGPPVGRRVEEKAPLMKMKDRESLVKAIAAQFQNHGQSNVNSLDFYAVGRLLGKGAFGKVNVAVHKLTEELSAMKQCDRRRMTEVGSKKCFLQEVAIMKRLTGHANVIQLFEVIETSEKIVLVMEFASGGDLLKYVRTRRRLAEPCGQELFKQLLDGLEHIHKNMVVHRDIKLENLLLDPFGCVKIADFGVAAVVQENKRLTDHCGTPSYIAPEILQDAGYEPFPVDVWSSGIALYAMLCGRLPFKGKSMSELKRCILRGRYPCPEHLSATAQELIASMLTLEPRSRITVRALLSHHFLEGVTSRAREIYGRIFSPKPFEEGKEGQVDLSVNDTTRALLQKVSDYGFPTTSAEESLTAGSFDHVTATFHLLAQQVFRGRAQHLQPITASGDPRPPQHDAEDCEDLEGGVDDVSTLIRAAPC